MRGEILSPCPVCKGSGVICYAIEYPGFEDRRCCPHCKAGWALADVLTKIVARTGSEERAQVA